MKTCRILATWILVTVSLVLLFQSVADAQPLKERHEFLFEQIQRVHGLSDKKMDSIRAIFRESGYIDQGDPAITEHPTTQKTCREKLGRLADRYGTPVLFLY